MKNKPYFTDRERKLLLKYARISFNLNAVYLITNAMITERKRCLCMENIVNFVIKDAPRMIPPMHPTLRKKCYLRSQVHPEVAALLDGNRTWLSD